MESNACRSCGTPGDPVEGRCADCQMPRLAGPDQRYYIAQGENIQGPFLLERVQELIQAGSVRSEMLFSMEGGPWRSGATCPELFPDAPPPPPSVPRPPPPPPGAGVGRHYVSATAGFPGATTGSYALESSRGGLILGLALGGIFFWPLAIVAYFLGKADLKRMDEGFMDADGRDLTQVGMWIGFAVCVLLLLVFVLWVGACGFIFTARSF